MGPKCKWTVFLRVGPAKGLAGLLYGRLETCPTRADLDRGVGYSYLRRAKWERKMFCAA